jgi:twitching motility protein PilT
MRDPELEQLVAELNQTRTAAEGADGEASAPAVPALGRQEVGSGSPLERVLQEMARRGASDLLLIAGVPPVLRVDGQLAVTEGEVLDADDLRQIFAPWLNRHTMARLEEEGSADFSLRLAPATASEAEGTGAWRFRVNLHRQRGALAAAVRALPLQIPTLTQLNLPQSLAELVAINRGLVLVSGPTGAGKSSTLAALVGEINRTRPVHVVTIEDPIEYDHRNGKAIIEQVEVGRDSPTFHAALRAALRQDPDVILVGEMRDLDTVGTALTAAETGHLILSTLHTSDVAQAIHRMVDVFPPAQQGQIRHQLALSLNAIVCQQLVPRLDGRGRVPALEILIANQPVRNHIRNERLQNLKQEITLGRRQGMISFEESLAQLAAAGIISAEEARMRARSQDELDTHLRG